MKDKKENKITPETILPVIRKTYPSKVSAEIITEQPLPPIEYKEPFEQLTIDGGWIHDFVRGYIFVPYRLVRNEVQYPKEEDKDSIFHLVITKELEELDRAETEEEYEKVKDKWQKMIDNFNKKD